MLYLILERPLPEWPLIPYLGPSLSIGVCPMAVPHVVAPLPFILVPVCVRVGASTVARVIGPITF